MQGAKDETQGAKGRASISAICNSYNMNARALAYLLHEGAKRPMAIIELSA